MFDSKIFIEVVKAISALEQKINEVIQFQLTTDKRVLELKKIVDELVDRVDAD